MNEDLNLRFGRRLQYLRKKIGATQKELAQLARLSSNYLALLEAGARSPSLPTIAALAKALRVPISKLMDLEAQDPEEKKKARPPLDYRERIKRLLLFKSEAKVKLAYEVIRKILE